MFATVKQQLPYITQKGNAKRNNTLNTTEIFPDKINTVPVEIISKQRRADTARGATLFMKNHQLRHVENLVFAPTGSKNKIGIFKIDKICRVQQPYLLKETISNQHKRGRRIINIPGHI